MSATEALARRPFNVALLNGVCVRHDAISYSLRLKLDLLRSLKAAGCPVEVHAFVQGTDYEDPDIRVRSLHGLVLDPDFARSDLIVYEFGIAYELFDSLFLLRDGQRSIGVYHNVTPLDLVDKPGDRAAVAHGLLVRRNLGELDYVACDSEFNRQDLLDCGVPGERLGVLPLPPRTSSPQLLDPHWSVDPVELLFVGRLVRAKGIHDLLDAVALLVAEGEHAFRLTLAGSRLFSDETIVESIRTAVGTADRSTVRLVADPDDAALDALYRGSSILVLPSHHEGYCVPVLEAFQAGCQVVASDAGNLPSIVGGLGRIVPTGDVRALASALREAIAATRSSTDGENARVPTADGVLPIDSWRAAVGEHLAMHTRERYERSFLDLLNSLGADFPLHHAAAAAQ